MKILVTVGTTSFDTLIQFLDEFKSSYQYDFIFQIADGIYIPKNHEYFRFDNNLWEKYKDIFVITHCGAGSFYYLLEQRIKFIGVPNLERVDQHQTDIANFVRNENLSTICFDFEELGQELSSQHFLSFVSKSYEKDSFFKGCEISKLISCNLNIKGKYFK